MLGLVLGDKFSTGKGDFVVTGIQFEQGKRIGVLIKSYITENDPHTQASFLSDEEIKENWNKIEYKGNQL